MFSGAKSPREIEGFFVFDLKLCIIKSNPETHQAVQTDPADVMQTALPQPHEGTTMATTTFSGPIVSTNGFTGDLTGDVTSTVYTVATLPAAVTAGVVLYCSDGNDGAATLVIANTAADTWVLASDGATEPSTGE